MTRPVPVWRADAALVLNTLIWGATFVLVKEALRGISPFLFLALRFSIAALMLAVLFRRSWSRPGAGPANLRGGAIAGVFLFLGYAMQTTGLQFTSASKSAFLTGLSTVMVPLLGALVYQNRPRLAEWLGVTIATGGMGLMTLESGKFGAVNPGDLLTLGCAVAFAAHIVTLGHYSREARFEVISLAQLMMAALLGLALFWWVETPRIVPGPLVWGALAVTSLLATAMAFTIQSWAQRYTSATRAALIFTLEPVFAWITSFLVMGESLAPRVAAGAGMILAGVLLVEVKPFTKQQHPSN